VQRYECEDEESRKAIVDTVIGDQSSNKILKVTSLAFLCYMRVQRSVGALYTMKRRPYTPYAACRIRATFGKRRKFVDVWIASIRRSEPTAVDPDPGMNCKDANAGVDMRYRVLLRTW
jgi:hypothetical protein